jgi:hypothetical protein
MKIEYQNYIQIASRCVYLSVFTLCVLVLYASGPYIRKKYGTTKKI